MILLLPTVIFNIIGGLLHLVLEIVFYGLPIKKVDAIAVKAKIKVFSNT